MIIDVHAHYVPAESQKIAAEIGKRHNLKYEQNAKGRNLLTRDGQLYLIVEDDGKGFDPSERNTSSGDRLGLGVLGIRERTALLGGTMEIESAKGAGTSIFVRLPIGSSASIVDATDMAGR